MTSPREANPIQKPRTLIVEDDPSFAQRLKRNLELDGFQGELAPNAEDALERLAEESFDLIITDLKMPGMGGLELIARVMKLYQSLETAPPPIAALTSVGDIKTVVEAMRRGASDYLTKELTREEIALRLRNLLKQGRLASEVQRLRRSLDRFTEPDEIVGQSESARALTRAIADVAPSAVTVLITGETGVGKELVARAIHRGSPRAAEPYVEVNCAALPDENLFLSELFGHERGAFTGAVSRKRGQFEMAHGGTLFLDEVGELGPAAQARLLRAVETQQFHRLGGEKPIQVNCRLVFATNKDLEEEVKADRFRRDLYYRINICPIHVPPLRARPDDIPALARFFAARMSEKHHLPVIDPTAEALEILRANPWPGNIRELRNVIERLSIRFAGRAVGAEQLRELNLGGGAAAAAGFAGMILPEGGVDLTEVERGLVMQALQRTNWSQRRAAELLKISVDRMNARVKKFGITHPSWRVHKDAAERAGEPVDL